MWRQGWVWRKLRAMHWAMAVGLVLATLVSGGCASSRPGHKLVWRTLSKGLISGLSSPRQMVIRDEAEYLKIWAEHASALNRLAMPPAVDFSREMVVMVAMGERPTGGYVTEVVDVELRGRTLRVLVGERTPRPGTMQIQQVTQPYTFVALPAVAVGVYFRTVQESDVFGTRSGSRPGSELKPEAATDSTGVVRPRVRIKPVESPRGASQ